MKKQPYILIGLTSFLFVAFLFRSIFKVLDIEWSSLFQDLEKPEIGLFLSFLGHEKTALYFNWSHFIPLCRLSNSKRF